MNPTTPEQNLALFAILGLAIAAAVQFFRWVFSGSKTPDPWDETITFAVDEPDSLPVCHRCMTEHSLVAHFCPQCGAAVGDFNNLLPFEQLFSEGEVLRNGTNVRMQPTFLRVAGYLLLSIVAYAPIFFITPVFWFFLIRNFSRRPHLVLPTDSGLPPVLPK
jgi:hypothetical protein